MKDLAAWQLRGPVRTLRTEIAEWDPDREEWRQSRHTADVTFSDAGQLTLSEFHNPDGSIFRQSRVYEGSRLVEEQHWTDEGPRTSRIHSYDPAGRRTEVIEIQPDGRQRIAERYRYDGRGQKTRMVFLEIPAGPVLGFGVEGAEHGCAPGLVMQTVGCGDGSEQADTVTVNNAAGEVISTTEFSRDEHDRIIREVVYRGSPTEPRLFSPDGIPPREREAFMTMLAAIMPDGAFANVVHEYDTRGRMIGRTRRFFGLLGEERTTFTFDEHDNPTLESSETTHQKAGFDPGGNLQTKSEGTRRHDVQFEYKYDEHGNWIERIVATRIDPSKPFQRTNAEWRIIGYHEGSSHSPVTQ